MASGLYNRKNYTKKKARNYRKEYDNYHSRRKVKKQRARNNKANRDMGTYGNKDGKDVAHSKPSALGRIYKQSPSKNRSFKRTKSAKRKKV
jgi:hypothetical protein